MGSPGPELRLGRFHRPAGHEYTYFFHPLRGKPSRLDRTAAPVRVTVRTEALYTKDQHDIFFNRGVASSQAYTRKFGNKKPDKLTPKSKAAEALQWLTRDLDEAILTFIKNARRGDTLLCCFYEFHYLPVVKALKEAIDRGVKVRIVIDAKVNERRDKNGKLIKSFPRMENLKSIKQAGIAKSHIIERDANPTSIQHNKFMVLLRGGQTDRRLDRVDEPVARRLQRADERRALGPEQGRGARVPEVLGHHLAQPRVGQG